MELDVPFAEKLINLNFSQKSKALVLRSVWYYIYSKNYNQNVINDFKKFIQKILASISANLMRQKRKNSIHLSKQMLEEKDPNAMVVEGLDAEQYDFSLDKIFQEDDS